MATNKLYGTILVLVTALLFMAMLFTISTCCSNRLKYSEQIEKIEALLPALSSYNFDAARLVNDELVLEPMTKQENKIQFINKHNIKMYHIERRGDNFRFVLGGAVDDEYGLIYVTDNKLMNFDFMNLYKVIGHPGWYEFDTMAK